MKLDMDLIRIILLKLESLDFENGFQDFASDSFQIYGHDIRDVHLHLGQMYDGGFYEASGQNWRRFRMLTWKGIDFIESIRDEDIWRNTKDGAIHAGGFTFDILNDLAKGFARNKTH